MRGSYRPHSLLELAPLVALFVRDRVARWRGAAAVTIEAPSTAAAARALRTRPAPEPMPAQTSSFVIEA